MVLSFLTARNIFDENYKQVVFLEKMKSQGTGGSGTFVTPGTTTSIFRWYECNLVDNS